MSTQRGGGAKDIWVLNGGTPESTAIPFPLWSPEQRRNDIPSRLVENLFWLGRYSVRCENKLRLLRGTLIARRDSPLGQHSLKLCTTLHAIAADGDPELAFQDPGDVIGLAADVRRFAWCASQVRNRLSVRYWRGVVALQRQLQEASLSHQQSARILRTHAAVARRARRILRHRHDARRGLAWHAAGACHRAHAVHRLHTRGIADQRHGRTREALEWLLEVCDSMNVYRQGFALAPHLAPVLTLLLGDDLHPGSLAFQARQVRKHLAALLPDTLEPDWQLAPVPVPSMDLADLRTGLQALSGSTGILSNRLSLRFFAHVDEDPRSLLS